MKTIKKVILILLVFFITCILTTMIKEINFPFLVIVPPLIGFIIIYKIIKK